MSIVSIRQLVKTFGTFNAVNHLDMDVEAGEVFGLLGLNGAGKSTTLRCLLSLIKPTSGQIKVFGYDIQKDRNKILSQIGCLVEKPDHYTFLSAQQNLQLQAGYYGIHPSKSDIENLLERVGLRTRPNQPVKTFSQGMKQRLGIACTLLHNPPLIILDEPANGLDPQGIIDLRHLILSLKNAYGKTVILSSHLLSEMEMIADSMVIVHKGQNKIQGRVADLLSEDDIIPYRHESKLKALHHLKLHWLPSGGLFGHYHEAY
jgi:ABC-type multidrug transport system ATPase subunit